MEKVELVELWEQLVKHMLKSAGPSAKAFCGFLSTTAPVDLVGDTLTLAVKTSFSKDYIERHYNELFKEAIKSVLGFPCKISYTTDPEYVGRVSEDFKTGELQKVMVPENALMGGDAKKITGNQEPKAYSQAETSKEALINQQEPAQDNVISQGRVALGRQMDVPLNQRPNNDSLIAAKKINPKGTYNPKFSFQNFVVGESNRFARAAALKVAEAPGKSYNPLFIHGSAGLGKTHLLNAIANYIVENYPYMRVVYVTSEDFVNDVVAATRYDLWDDFMLKYRSADVFLLDDVQFLEGKDTSITNLFNTFNDLKNNGSAIVLTADREPKDLDMDERMRSRFNEGLNVKITAPDFETRYAILQNYLETEPEAQDLLIPDDVLIHIAKISNTNIRELDGAIAKIVAYLRLYGKTSIEAEEARDILANFFPDETEIQISINDIQDIVERQYGVTHEELIGASRTRNINEARQIAMFLSRQMTEKSYPDIGRYFGGRDHTTIMHGVRKIEDLMKHNEVIYKQLETLTSLINERCKNHG